jgi:saccharopine dehydrogenase-like NADP-dependent oxidoreductase
LVRPGAPLAAERALPSRAFALTAPAECESGLAGVTVLLNCAGPFSRTAAPLIAACLATNTHYLDITVVTPAPPALRLAMKALAFLCRSATITSFLTARINASVAGPTGAQRDASPA